MRECWYGWVTYQQNEGIRIQALLKQSSRNGEQARWNPSPTEFLSTGMFVFEWHTECNRAKTTVLITTLVRRLSDVMENESRLNCCFTKGPSTDMFETGCLYKKRRRWDSATLSGIAIASTSALAKAAERHSQIWCLEGSHIEKALCADVNKVWNGNWFNGY